MRNSVELLGLPISYRLCPNEAGFEGGRLSSLVLVDYHSVGGGERRAYAKLTRCACVHSRGQCSKG